MLKNEEKNTAPRQKYIHVQAPTATMNKRSAFKVPLQTEPRFHLRRYEQPHTIGGPAEQQKTDGWLAVARSGSGNDDLRPGRRSSFSSGFRAGAAAEGLSPTDDESRPFRPGDGAPGLLTETRGYRRPDVGCGAAPWLSDGGPPLPAWLEEVFVKLEDAVLPQTPGEEEGNRPPRRQPPDSPHPPSWPR